MKTLILEEPLHLTLLETAEPSPPAANEALVRVRRVGICGTDLHAFEGTQPFLSYPRILGHELAVEVLAIGANSDDTSIQIGEICALNPYMNCGTCISCRRGVTNACVNMQVLGVHRDGGMREKIVVPIHKLHSARGIPIEHVALVEMLCIGAHAVRRAQLTAGENVLVIGAGPIGLGVMQFARLAGANVIVMDVNSTRLAFCREHLGIEHTINAREEPLEQLMALSSNELPTAVFDATGNSQSMMAAFQYVAHSGRLVYVGLFRGDVNFSDPHFHSREMTLLASRNATDSDFQWVLESLAAGKVTLNGWVTHHVTPEIAVIDFVSWLKPETGVIKAMLSF